MYLEDYLLTRCFVPLSGCPIRQDIVDSGTASAYGDGLQRGEEDKPATFYVDSGGRQGDLDVSVDGKQFSQSVHAISLLLFQGGQKCIPTRAKKKFLPPMSLFQKDTLILRNSVSS